MSNDLTDADRKLIPAEPDSTQVIRQVTPQITTVSAPFSRFGVFKIGSRATIGTSTPEHRGMGEIEKWN